MSDDQLEQQFASTVRPFLETYCVNCHGGARPAAQFNLRAYENVAAVVADAAHWTTVLEKLDANQMPPSQAKQPAAGERLQVAEWVRAVLRNEARKHAGDPGLVLARRLSNAEYNYTIRDLTGVDLRPTREFPVDPTNPAGFDNSGESLAMSPALMTKYLQAAREVANHLVLKPAGFAFAPHPMLVETDRDRYCVNQIIEFYKRFDTDLSHYFEAAWQKKHRVQVDVVSGVSRARLSPKYLAEVWRALEETQENAGPLAELQKMWKAIPAPRQSGADRRPFAAMRDFVVAERKKTSFTFTPIQVKGVSATAQPFLMWRNKQYAANRMTATLPPELQGDPRIEAAHARFAAVFPDAFYVSERGRYFPDNTRDTGRHLSAGFHNVMGYFRDDRPFYELMLDAREQKELDGLWQELDFVASGNIRTYIQFFLNESGEARGQNKESKESEGPRPKDKEITSETMIADVAEAYRTRVRASGNAVALQAIDEHFAWVNAGIRAIERARIEAEPSHLASLADFAGRAFRRPLSPAERADLLAYYRTLREKDGLDHEEAMRDSIVGILMSPDFCYRIDLAAAGQGISRLSDHALASRLSYFLWSSLPDAELLSHAAAGDLHDPAVLVRQARRMLKDERVRGLATEFGGHWLDFRRFEEHNAVDRDRFGSFTNELRQAMFDEPIRFVDDVLRHDRSVLDFVYGTHTFVNGTLAKHYGMPEPAAGGWVRVDNATQYDRGGLLPMAVFLTKNAPGLRTSPVKRGYWVVKQVLGERIPPPPAVVPELPRDEATLDLPLRDMLARHRQDKSCASCHARFDALGLVFEGFGMVGERRSQDLAGRAIDASATFPDGSQGAGVAGLRAYIKAHRQDDFLDNLARKLLAYALGRSLMLSDDPAIDDMRARLARDQYRFSSLVEAIVTSRQFLNKRGRESR